MKINEIFYSLQGEGQHTGKPAVFLRMAGCNRQCHFCDTDHEPHRDMTVEEIVAEAIKYPARTVVITGGEPTMQLTAELTQALHSHGFSIHIETNGTLPLPQGAEVDWVTCSPKDGALPIIERIDELKVVYYGQDVSHSESLPMSKRLQPLDSGEPKRNQEITEQTIDYILKHPAWTLSLQTHKILNVR